MSYGLPYKGSKNKLAGQIFELFQPKKNFYDLFCGGCAITHYGLLHGGFENFYINDINPACPELFMDAVHGKFKDEIEIKKDSVIYCDIPYEGTDSLLFIFFQICFIK